MDLPPEAAALLALPPARFTAARGEVVRALAARGDPAAAAVRALRRPVGLAWVLNRLSRDHPGEVRALLSAGERLRAGQRRAVSGAGAEALREAEAAVRERARALRGEAESILAAEGRPPAPTALARIELLLRVAASGPAGPELEAGTLAREPPVGDAGLSGLTLLAGAPGAAAPAAPARAPARPARGARAAAESTAARATRDRELDARRQAERDARDAARRRKERDRAVATAHAAAARAAARAEQAERAAEHAESNARQARERAAAARADANRLAARALEIERNGR